MMGAVISSYKNREVSVEETRLKWLQAPLQGTISSISSHPFHSYPQQASFFPLKQRSLMLSGTRNRLGRNGIQLSSSHDPWAVCLCPRESMTTFCPKLGLHIILWLRKPLHYWHCWDVLWSNRLPSASSLGTPWLNGQWVLWENPKCSFSLIHCPAPCHRPLHTPEGNRNK